MIEDQEDQEEEEKNTFTLIDRLFHKSFVEETTFLNFENKHIEQILGSYAELELTFRLKYTKNKRIPVIAMLYFRGLKLNKSLKGWRSEQLVRIMKQSDINAESNDISLKDLLEDKAIGRKIIKEN